MLCEEDSVLVTFELLLTVSWLFCPREYPVRVADDPLIWSIVLVCFTSVPVVETSLAALLSYMLAPSPTSASDELTILTPVEPSSAVPERFTVPVLFSVTVELLAAIAEFSSPAAVTLSIWVSLIACALCLVDDWSLFCP
jgi:hypothetical protein